MDRGDARDHISNETLVAGNIDNPDVNLFALRSGEIEFGKSEIDRNAARFFFRQSVRISSGQRFDQCALAVIDVAGGGEDEILCHRDVETVRMASTSKSSW